MSNITLRDGERHLGELFASSPVAAARNGVLGMLYDAVTAQDVPMTDRLDEAAAPLLAELKCGHLYDVGTAMRAMNGRPPRRVTGALRSPDMVSALCQSLDMLGLIDLSDRVSTWGPQGSGGVESVLPLPEAARKARAELVDALQARVVELLAEWQRLRVKLVPGPSAIDGRSLLAAARAWQLPMINGEMPSLPVATAAMHPNRLGRTAAAVAYARLNAALRSAAPVDALAEPLAMLVAVGEAISPVDWVRSRTAAMHGLVELRVRVGDPIGDESLCADSWWPVFNSWGTSSKRMAAAIPTAWRLTEVQGDVVVWALCSVAARLAVASTMPPADRRVEAVTTDRWAEHVEAELPEWESGAQSVWSLLQQPRPFEVRTAWPGCLYPRCGVDYSWPWRP